MPGNIEMSTDQKTKKTHALTRHDASLSAGPAEQMSAVISVQAGTVIDQTQMIAVTQERQTGVPCAGTEVRPGQVWKTRIDDGPNKPIEWLLMVLQHGCHTTVTHPVWECLILDSDFVHERGELANVSFNGVDMSVCELVCDA